MFNIIATLFTKCYTWIISAFTATEKRLSQLRAPDPELLYEVGKAKVTITINQNEVYVLNFVGYISLFPTMAFDEDVVIKSNVKSVIKAWREEIGRTNTIKINDTLIPLHKVDRIDIAYQEYKVSRS